ncbi:hypothetical protein Tco_1360563 [Tanacetum coccineum]
METKDTLSSCSYSDEQDMQQMLKQAKILKGGCLNGLSALKSHFTRILEPGITKSEFERAFSHIFGEDVNTFTRTFSQNMDTLEQQLTKETILESNCQNAFRVLMTQFEKIFSSVLIKPSSLDGMYARKDFRAYTSMEPQLFKEIILKNFDFIEDYMLKTIIHAQTIQKRLDDKKLQIQECTVQEVKLDAFRRQSKKELHGTMFLNMDQLEKQLDKEEFQEIGSTASFKIRYRQTEGKIDMGKAVELVWLNNRKIGTRIQKEQDTSKQIMELSNIRSPYIDEEPMVEYKQTTEINILLLGTTAYLKQLDSIMKESNEAKVKHDIDVIETINIELEHKVAKLLEENETLKRHYKEMFDSIKTIRAKNIEHTTSLIAIMKLPKLQLQEKGFAIAALKNELRKLTGNSVNTKFAKSSILGKPALQPRRNQSVVRQPTAFKSERPSLSKQRFASQVDVNNDLSKPVTITVLLRNRESACKTSSHDCTWHI